MRILLTSDWHLGKSLYSVKLLQEQALFFEKSFFPLLKEEKPDLLIVAGDILDKPIPDQETLLLYEELLKELASLKIPSIFILGNHDSKRTALHKYFLELAQIYLVDDLRYFFKPFLFQNERGEKIFLHLLPYLPFYELFEKAKSEGFFLPSEEINLETLLLGLFEGISIRSPSFLVSHFAVIKGKFSGEEIQIKGLSLDYLMPHSLFEKFDFLFLGHLHRPQIQEKRVFYPGAPLPYSFETYEEKRGVYFFEIKEKNHFTFKFLHLSPSYELKLFKGSFEELMRLERTHSYVKVILQDEMPVFNAFERLKERFPRLLSLEYETSFTPKELNFEILEIEEVSLDERKLFCEFYQFIEGKEMNLTLQSLFERYLEEFYKLEREEGRLCQ